MRQRRLYILFSSFVTLLAVSAYAQKLPSKCQVFQPEPLQAKLITERATSTVLNSNTYCQDVKPKERMYWTVWSDRSDNTTYTKDKKPYKTLNFNEELRIAEISGNDALVYIEPKAQTQWPQISSDAVSMGWVPMDHLLLWASCPANARGIYNKALLCINADEMTSQSSDYGLAYKNPEKENSKFKLATDMNFYFVMKTSSDGKVLLATQHNMLGGQSSKILYGWVPKNSYVPWNQRSCLEPTWEDEDAEYFAARGITSKVFENKSLTGEEAAVITYKKSDKPYEEYRYRMEPQALRFPILDGTNSTEYECSSFTSSTGKVDVVNETKKNVTLDSKKLASLNKLKKINLVIVIDGTQSMDPYYPAVQRAIKDGCDFFDKGKYDVKVGALIYRDYPDGDGIVESYRLTKPNDEGLFQFLSEGGKYGIKSSPNDKTFSEAFYYGVNAALDKFFTSPDEGNLMLVVGDCGNEPDDPKAPSLESITKKIVDKNVNLVGYQVRNVDSDAWNQFNRQILGLMKNSLKEKYDKLGEYNKSAKGSAKWVRAKVEKDGQIFLNTKDDNPLFINTHRYAVQGSEIAPEVLAVMMKNSIRDFSSEVQKQIDKIVQANATDLTPDNDDLVSFSGSEATKEAVTAAINKAWLIRRLGANVVEKAKNVLISFRGWTAKKDPSGRDFYKTVLFISSEEFDELMSRLKPVADVAKQSNADNRKPYIDAIKALLKSMAPGITNAEMDQKGIGEVMVMIEGLNARSASMEQEGGRTLLEISDENAVKPAEYRRLVNDFARKYDNLSHIKDAHYKYVREFNGAKYYWIPIETLP